MRKFTFKQDLANSDTLTHFNTQSTAFGDGYEQHISIGMRNRKNTINYQRTAKREEIVQIKSFFDEHKGAKAFLYSTLLDGEIQVITGEYQISNLGGGIFQITTTFTQVFYP